MITLRENESRPSYLLRVAVKHIRAHAADCETDYDGTNCDGYCLADELETEQEELEETRVASHNPDAP